MWRSCHSINSTCRADVCASILKSRVFLGLIVVKVVLTSRLFFNLRTAMEPPPNDEDYDELPGATLPAIVNLQTSSTDRFDELDCVPYSKERDSMSVIYLGPTLAYSSSRIASADDVYDDDGDKVTLHAAHPAAS